MARLFTAIALDRAARDRVAAAEQDLVVELRGSSLRWVRAEHLHLTLVFLGEVPENLAATVVQAMHQDIPRPPFRIELGGLGVFPSHGAPRALWLGVRDGADAVIGLQRTVAARIHELGFAPEPRPFSPHLTLARFRGRDGRSSERPRGLVAGRETIATVEVGAVALFQSRLSSEGPSYAVLAESRLTGSNPSMH